MARDDEPADPSKQLKQGLGLLFKAARGLAKEARKELENTDFGKALDDAGRELVRATSSVVNRLADEVNAVAKTKAESPHRRETPRPEQEGEGARADGEDGEEDEFDGVKPRARPATESTPSEPRPRIVVEPGEETKKPS